MMESQYRAFGDALKVQLTAGESIDLATPATALRAAYPNAFPTFGSIPNMMHVVVQEVGAISYKLRNDIKGSTTYTIATTVVGQQIAACSQITCTTGQVQVIFLS